MSPKLRTALLGASLVLGAASLSIQTFAADETMVPARWKVQEIRYSYMGFTTAYDCDAAANKIEAILETLGAHPSTRVRATGCPTNRPSRHFFVTVTAAVPVPAAEFEQTQAEKSREELLERLGVKPDFLDEEFIASWKSVELHKQRRLNIEPGDCELMEGVRDHVLPKLGMKIEEQRIVCTPNQPTVQPPQLRVAALVKAESPDTAPVDSP